MGPPGAQRGSGGLNVAVRRLGARAQGTPNQRFMSLHDFRDLALKLDCVILRELPIIQGRAVEKAWAANLRADHVLYVLEHCSRTTT